MARRVGAAALSWVMLAATPARAGTTACWLDHGALVAPAAFGDIAGDFMIDLSRPRSALHDTRADEDGVTTDTARGPLTLAGERIKDLGVAVADLDSDTRPFDTVINGILGWDVLGRYVVRLDLRRGHCRLSLARAGGAARPRGARLPLANIDGTPVVPATVADGVRARHGLFLIDTRQDTVRVADASLSRPREGKDSDAPIRLRAVSIGGALLEQVPAAVMDPPKAAVEGSLGLSVWRGGVLRLDPVRGRAVFWSPRQDR